VTRPRDPQILVTGATGQVGGQLLRELAVLGRVVAPSRAEVDLAQPDTIIRAMRAARPNVIVNAGAYTAVDQAESNVDLCTRINGEAPGVLADEAAAIGAWLVHYSTDYVFDGRSDVPYRENDAPSPLNVYGASKLAGERAIEERGGSYLIFRTSWVYGASGTNFLRTIRRLSRERSELRIVADQIGAPTWSRMIAAATAHALRSVLHAAKSPSGDESGLYHLTASGSGSWFDFAQAIIDGDPHPTELRCRHAVPIATDQYPTAAQRPRNSLLDTRRFRERFHLSLPDWREQLALVLADLRTNN